MAKFALKPVEPTEAQTQSAILRYLAMERRVAWAERVNTGAHVVDSKDKAGRPNRRFIRYGFPGCADIIGQLTDGRFLAVEVKSPKGRATEAQQAFLERVRAAGGVAVLARSVEDVRGALA